jgi:hypothetical protein
VNYQLGDFWLRQSIHGRTQFAVLTAANAVKRVNAQWKESHEASMALNTSRSSRFKQRRGIE